MLKIDQEKMDREFANSFINAVSDMRIKMKKYYKLRNEKRLLPHEQILKGALHDSIIAEKRVDDLIESVLVKQAIPKSLFDEK